ncbi:hypothetical protein EQM14_10715 [Caproiciproducens sp. NJN-50]|uniref:hypothetical protein n=1 Tax=Acutalibacteraceae TaxID=3082771 RepID=UPI000FFE12BD|nr:MULTISPECIES: hypothetical protein [Acutalibacteraceae]QAT50201.1 hypothetical protein EQM14_10715 [Caproiciproducens sp. NJN-50]
MKKWNRFRTGTLLLAFACLIGTSACSSAQTSASSAASSTQADESASTSSGDQNTIYGKVTAVDGEKITLSVGTLNVRGGPKDQAGSGQGPDGGNGDASGSAPGGSRERQGSGGSLPEGKSGARPEGAASGTGNASGSDPKGGFDNLLTLTGETKTITVSDESVLSKQEMGRERGSQETSSGESSAASQQTGETTASLSDIQEGTILKIVYQPDGQTLSAVVILGGSAKS